MSAPQPIPGAGEPRGTSDKATGTPPTSPGKTPPFLIPSPIPTKRNRTYSASERALRGPSFKGVVEKFCREKGHGFIFPDNGGPHLFVHISDIDGDYVPKAGDIVSYKTCMIPPKNEKFSAVHVQIIRPKEGVRHETWDTPVEHHKS